MYYYVVALSVRAVCFHKKHGVKKVTLSLKLTKTKSPERKLGAFLVLRIVIPAAEPGTTQLFASSAYEEIRVF